MKRGLDSTKLRAVLRVVPISLLVLMPVGLGLAACGDAGGGSVTGAALVVPDCDGAGKPHTFEPFEMDLGFASLNESGGVATIRLAPRANRIVAVDQMGVVVYDVAAVREALKAGGSVSLPIAVTLDEQPADLDGASLSFTFLGRCKNPAAALGGVGTIEVEAFGRKPDEAVRASFTVDIVDRRTGEVVGPGVTGDIDFVIQTGSPYTAFAPHDF